MFIDTHCHLDVIHLKKEKTLLEKEDFNQIKKMVDYASANQVEKIINIGCDWQTSRNSVELAKKFENVFATIGIHPTECNYDWKDEFAKIKKIAKEERSFVAGIGEIGLDYYHKPFDKQKQVDALRAQIELALLLNLPVSIHVRAAGDDILKILEEYKKEIKGIIHCFEQSYDFAKEVTSWGMALGIGGIITYPKNQELRETVKKIGLSNLVLETDAPFLPPQHMRGKTNYPENVVCVAQKISEILGTDLEEVKSKTTKKVLSIFNLKK